MNNPIYQAAKTQIEVYCECVQTGCKPCALIPLQTRYVEQAQQIADTYNVKTHTQFLYEGWVTLFFYKLPIMLEVIKHMKEPTTIFDHWLLGKAFGYSDQEIQNHVDRPNIKAKLL